MELLITPDIRRRAKKAGACSVPGIGTPIGEVSQENLIWVESNGVLTPEEIASLPSPLWSLGHSGYGYGDGDGSGDGSGYGYGDGSGSGYGSGYGYGDGYGDGYGYGYGSGYGSGDGSGDGSGASN